MWAFTAHTQLSLAFVHNILQKLLIRSALNVTRVQRQKKKKNDKKPACRATTHYSLMSSKSNCFFIRSVFFTRIITSSPS